MCKQFVDFPNSGSNVSWRFVSHGSAAQRSYRQNTSRVAAVARMILKEAKGARSRKGQVNRPDLPDILQRRKSCFKALSFTNLSLSLLSGKSGGTACIE